MTDMDPTPDGPLKPAWFHILLTLAEEPAHGYAIRKAVEARTDGALKLWPTTLYGALSDLCDLAYIVEDPDEEDADDNLGRIRYRLTDVGHRALAAETNRLDALVRAARAAQGARPRTA
jgi:DNA-binding PadR family transcriptional regulator